jgi:hypothetical protein
MPNTMRPLDMAVLTPQRSAFATACRPISCTRRLQSTCSAPSDASFIVRTALQKLQRMRTGIN